MMAEIPTIIVIDDEPDILTVSTFRLRKLGYRVLTATTGAEGLRIIREELPDLIFLDLLMKDVDGYQVCRELKADEKTKDIPVVLFTAMEERQMPNARKETGAQGWLLKPFRPDDLLAVVREFLPELS